MTGRSGYPVVQCEACGLLYTDDRSAPPPAELYPAFDQSQTAAQSKIRSAVSVFLRQRAGFVEEVAPHGRLLDYGCGNGAFARFMSQRGFEAVGLEPFSLGAPSQDGTLRLLRAPLEQVEGELGEFDVITLWHVLEHLADPVTVLERLAAHLKPEGVLVVSVPNAASWQARLFGGGWFHLDPPRHLIHFDQTTLEATLGRAGLAKVAERRFLPEYGSSGWVQSALNAVLPHENYLYELVKDRGALARMTKASAAGHLVGSMLLGAPVFALSYPVEALASLSNRGAALTVAARRS
jgi:SAM-dependent methyltransferase